MVKRRMTTRVIYTLSRSLLTVTRWPSVRISITAMEGTPVMFASIRGRALHGSQLGADIDGEAADDWSGSAVSLSSDGQTVAIGAYQNDGIYSWGGSGHVRIYSWTGSAWSQLGADIDGEEQGDSASWVSMSANGQTIAIGARYNQGNGQSSGHVRIYSWTGSAWSQLGADIDGEAAGDNSGSPVSLSADGQTVAIGAYQNDGNGSGSGHVRIYSWTVLHGASSGPISMVKWPMTIQGRINFC